MQPRSREYPQRSKQIIEDEPHVRDAVTAATTSFEAHRLAAYSEIDEDAFREWAKGVKGHALTHLDAYLEEAEARLTERGVQVHWAETAEDVHSVLAEIVRSGGVRKVVKGKSMVSEEVAVNPALEALGVEVFETDLGEYIIQLLGEPPSHIVGPAIHKSLDDVRELFHERLGTPMDSSPEELASAARDVLREAFLTADMGISGGNFLVAETGSVALIENEGNIRLSTSIPRIHVALVGIEKIIPRWSDLPHFLQITTRAATGQPIGCFVSVIQGPGGARGGEIDGPEEMHVVLIDNGRTRVLADPEIWEALRCVRCGACLNICPVYRQTGGHAYGYVYSGPIGSVLSPGLLGLEETLPLPFASTLCGACADACPVKIPIPDLLLTWRRRAVDQGLTSSLETAMLRGWGVAATRPALYGWAEKVVAKTPILKSRRLPMIGEWNEGREPPRAEGPTFRERWRKGIT